MKKELSLKLQQKQRERIRSKCHNRCHFCEKDISYNKSNTVHHICPQGLGGDWHLYNLVCLCSQCHNKLETLNKRMLVRLLKSNHLERYLGGNKLDNQLTQSKRIFNLKYKSNFKWFGNEIDNLFKKKIIEIEVLNKINSLKNNLIDRLNYNHSIDMNHIDVLKQRLLEIESKMKKLRGKKHYYRTEYFKLKGSTFKDEETK